MKRRKFQFAVSKQWMVAPLTLWSTPPQHCAVLTKPGLEALFFLLCGVLGPVVCPTQGPSPFGTEMGMAPTQATGAEQKSAMRIPSFPHWQLTNDTLAVQHVLLRLELWVRLSPCLPVRWDGSRGQKFCLIPPDARSPNMFPGVLTLPGTRVNFCAGRKAVFTFLLRNGMMGWLII